MKLYIKFKWIFLFYPASLKLISRTRRVISEFLHYSIRHKELHIHNWRHAIRHSQFNTQTHTDTQLDTILHKQLDTHTHTFKYT